MMGSVGIGGGYIKKFFATHRLYISTIIFVCQGLAVVLKYNRSQRRLCGYVYVKVNNKIMPKKIFITNIQGEREPFSAKKVYRSAKRVGASDQEARKIASIIEQDVYSGMKTTEIFARAREMLEKKDQKALMRFNLREAMRKLGPTGYSFEKYAGEIFKSMGYGVRMNLFISGKCATYEIDFLAEKDDFIYIAECKYHKLPEGKVDLQASLANCARFRDIMDSGKFEGKEVKSILVTNTKFTSEAIKYSECRNIDLLGWKYPAEQGLEYLIESRNLYPLTILPSFSGRLSEALAGQKTMLAKNILEMRDDDSLQNQISGNKGFSALVEEAEILLKK